MNETAAAERSRTMHVIVTCTSRKTLPVPPGLRLDSTCSRDPKERAQEWIGRLTDAERCADYRGRGSVCG